MVYFDIFQIHVGRRSRIILISMKFCERSSENPKERWFEYLGKLMGVVTQVDISTKWKYETVKVQFNN